MSILKDFIAKSRIKSPWIVHFDCGSCNGCDIETLAALTPLYDVERFGIVNVGNPKHADILVVTGTVNYRNQHVLRTIYEQMPHPKAVLALGACGLSGGVFRDCYNVIGGIDRVIPVDVYVPGCPPKPEAIIDGAVLALEKFAAKARGEDVSRFETRRPFDKTAHKAAQDVADLADVADQTDLADLADSPTTASQEG